jgi:endonuclease-3
LTVDNRSIHPVIRILKREVKRWQTPAVGLFTRDPFLVLVSCLLSLRTRDVVTKAASERLFALAQTPEELLRLDVRTLEKTIYPVSFYRVKARTLKKIAAQLIGRFNSGVPDSIDDLLTLPGVGRKTANLVVTLGFRRPGICVDTHVHRISNRWGYVKTKTPDETEAALRKKLPKPYWMVLNDLLVAYGQNLCGPISPWCSRCKISRYCDRIGVKVSR